MVRAVISRQWSDQLKVRDSLPGGLLRGLLNQVWVREWNGGQRGTRTWNGMVLATQWPEEHMHDACLQLMVFNFL